MTGGISRLVLSLTFVLAVAACSSNSGLQSAGVLPPVSTASSDGKAKPFDPFEDREGSADIGRRHVIQNPTVEQVMKPGPLPEMSLGRADAPVTIIKYASLTCPFCRKFQTETYPVLKREYIDTGKVRYILREFPIGFQSGTATIALRCAPANRYFDLYDKFMKQQKSWVSQTVRREPIFKVARQVGLTRSQFDACFADKSLAEKLNAVKERGRTLGIIGTPNFFINGKLYKRRLGTSDIHSLVAEALAKPVAAAN
ncbi:MAG: DsbA family protein, partial [Pseudomonadota bacterium]